MSKQYPRRRDVRDMMTMILNITVDHLYTDDETGEVEFDREFLTEVRDMLRDGVSLEEVFVVFDAAQADEAEEEEEAEEAAIQEAEAIYDALDYVGDLYE